MPKPLLYTRNTPTWIILIIDFAIVFFSLGLAYLVRFNFKIPESEYLTFYWVFPFVFGSRALSFLIGKTYQGMIRYTSSKDAQRVFLVTLFGSLFFVLCNLIKYYLIDTTFIVPFSVIIIEFFSTVMLLASFRIAVKQIFFEFKNASADSQLVVIYGAGESGVITKRTLDRVTRIRNEVVAFLDDNPKKRHKKIEGINIYPPKYLDNLLEKNEIDHLIIAFQGIPMERRKEIIEKSLKHNVRVSNVPPPSDWLNGELTYKQIEKVKIEDLLGRSQIKLNRVEINKYISGKVVMITGAAGSIGGELVKQISPFNPQKLILVDQAESPIYDLDIDIRSKYGEQLTEVVVADVRNNSRMKSVFKEYRPQIVFHAAAYKHVPLMETNPTEAVRTNVQGTKTLVDLSSEYEVEKFIMISTDKAVNPTNIMGATKRVAEMYIQALNENSTTKFITT